MGKLKIIAKSHMLSKTAPIFITFTLCLSVLFFSGDLSLLAGYAVDAFGLDGLFSQPLYRRIFIIACSAVGAALMILLCAPLRLGRERWFMMNARGEDPKLGELFYYFNRRRFPRSVRAWLFALTVSSASALLFFFPVICLSGVLYYCLSSQNAAFPTVVCLAVADIALFAVGAAFLFAYNGEFLMYYPIIVSSDKIGPVQAYSYSRKMTSPALSRVCRFRLSFAPWWLLCLLVAPTFYVWGYYKQSLAELAYRNEYLR